jgi:transposase
MMLLGKEAGMRIQEREVGDLSRLKALARREADAEQRDRYRAARLAIEGVETSEIQRRLDRSRGFVQRWAYAYRDAPVPGSGIDALARVPHPGKPSKLPARLHERLRSRLDAGPTRADNICALRAKDLQRIVRDELGVNLSVSSVYRTLHKMGYSCLSPRPRHEKQNLEAQRKFQQQDAPFLSAH